MQGWRRILPPTVLERDLVYQSVLSAFATGTFLTGTAVYFTQVVGLTGAQVGLGMSVAALVALVLQIPMGRLADRMGAKPLWVLSAAVEAALYFVWPFIGGLVGYIAMLSVLAVFESAGRNARNVYRLAVFSREQRVRSMAYQRAARNVGYTLGAGASGVALGLGLSAVKLIPLLTGALLVINAIQVITRLPAIERPVPTATIEDALEAAPAAWRNRGFVALAMGNGVLASNQVLLNVVVPLWLVSRTDAPHTLLAWLFGTNTVLAVLLQVRASRVADSVNGCLRAVRWSGWAFVISCAIIAVTHQTVGWVSILLIWAGHVTITGAELWQSAADWGFTSELSDHRRLGDYQGIWGLGYQIEPIIFPALYTFLALQWGTVGWAVIAVIAVAAAAAMHPAARAAQRHLVAVGAPAP
ncbi:membrane protein [Arsenicicoccus piscis]|uniref:Membrane protein n=2 Tax=Arsenicicoccus piscis TaxID=673954 RepID=A0ABQ6HW61_9MICO|nr:membrane protein [Arsenicicoccus piscis]GMA22169.1 membrane protein [Arsenicicoccus piscis]GMA22217.1 membrane protein [Arsenicicoccus piscis]